MIAKLRNDAIACVNESCDDMRDDIDTFDVEYIDAYVEMIARVRDNAHNVLCVVSHYESITCTFDDVDVDVQQREMLNVMRVMRSNRNTHNANDIDTICNMICDVFDM